MAPLAKAISIPASGKEEDAILAEWSDYYNRSYVNREGLPARNELLRFYRNHDTTEKILAFYNRGRG